MSSNDKPIGIFDSGLGGLTVARAISRALPFESITYVGDTKRCPYGPRDQSEVRRFVRQVGEWLRQRDVKCVVIACNTATAAGLDLLQRTLDVPVMGVIEPGARAATQTTHTRHVGILGTQGTVDSCAYVRAIHGLDAGVRVTQQPAARFVDIVEEKLVSGECLRADWMRDRQIFDTPEIRSDVTCGVEALKGSDIDTVVLACTHFPLLSRQIEDALGPDVTVVSSAEETCRELIETLSRRGDLVECDHEPVYRFATTSDDITSFAVAGSFVFGKDLSSIEHIDLDTLEALVDEVEPVED